MQRIAFLGYGKVGKCLSHALAAQSSITSIRVYVRNLEKYAEQIQNAPSDKMIFTDQIRDALAGSELVISAVWPGAAVEVAELAAPLMKKGQTLLDLNTISTTTAEEVAEFARQGEIPFVKGVIMGGTDIYGASVPILVGGEKSDELAGLLTSLGLEVQGIGSDIRKPAMIKIIRSVLLKGITALLYEAGKAGERVGLRELVISSAVESITYRDVGEIFRLWLEDILAQPERRIEEMGECRDLLEELGVEPIMTLATQQTFERMRAEKVLAGE